MPHKENRYNNISDINKYIEVLTNNIKENSINNVENSSKVENQVNILNSIVKNLQQLTERDRMEEFMFLGLRKRAGISKKEFRECFHKNIMDVYGEVISKYEKIDLLEWIKNGEMLRLTDAGIDVSDYIFCDFML